MARRPTESAASETSSTYLWPGRVLSVLALAYVMARAARVPITHDEAVTYLSHASASLSDVLAYKGLFPSNNHLLNTLLMKLSVALFGPSELAVRFPAIVGFCLYLVGVDRLVRFLPKGRTRGLGSVLLLAQPFLLEFFAFARGYSLGLGFMALGLASLWRLLDRGELESAGPGAMRTTLFFALSVLASLTFIPVYVSVLAIVLVEGGLRARKLKVTVLATIPSIVVVTALAAMPLLEMRAEGELYAGGDSGLWGDTLVSLGRAALYGRWSSSSLAPILVAAVAFLIVACSVVVMMLTIRKGSSKGFEVRALASAIGMLLGSLGLLLAQHHLLGINYPLPRMAIYLLVLAPIVTLFACSAHGGRWSSFFQWSLAAVFLLHLATSFGVSRQYSWRYDASTPQMLTFLEGRVAEGEALKRPLSLGIHWQLEPGINFYLHQRRIGWMTPVSRRGPDGDYDYYYLLAGDHALDGRLRLRILREFPAAGTILAVPQR